MHPTTYTLHPTPYTLHSTLYTLHPTLYILHSTPYTLHSTLYTLHPTLYTIHSLDEDGGTLQASNTDGGTLHASNTDPGPRLGETMRSSRTPSATPSCFLFLNSGRIVSCGRGDALYAQCRIDCTRCMPEEAERRIAEQDSTGHQQNGEPL